jgi:uncharacterized delta-60 repeat protein
VVAAASIAFATALAASAAPSSPADLDQAFGTGGVVTTDFGATESGEAMTLLPDGRIVVAGGLNPDSDDYDSDEFVVARYSAEGLLDPTFDGDGRVTTDVGGPRDEAFAVAAQPDGKILAGGWAGPSLTFALVRYTTAGSLDPEFGGGDGKVSTSFGASYGAIHDLALQPDGKIIAVGGQCGVELCDVALARYLTDGAPDPSFSEDGKLQTPLGGSSAAAVAIQADGKIVVAGRRCAPTCSEFALLRYDTEGNLDPTFDGDGKVFTDLGGTYEWAEALALQSDGRIVAAGAKDLAFAIVRYDVNGSLDAGFSGDGIVTDPAGSGANALAIRGDGKILAAGSRWGDFALLRVTSDGSIDTSFSADGRVITDFNQTHDYATAIALQSDGKVIAAGASGNLGATEFGGDFALARYLADGAPPPPAPLPPPPPLAPPSVRPPSAQVRCVVPNVKRKTLAQARRLLAARRCALGRVSRAYSATIRKGRVTSQRPPVGRRLPRGTKVHVTVSRGRGPVRPV